MNKKTENIVSRYMPFIILAIGAAVMVYMHCRYNIPCEKVCMHDHGHDCHDD